MRRVTLAFCCLFSLALSASPLLADEGNGAGNAYVEHTPARLGGLIRVDFGSPGLAGGHALLIISDGIGPVTYPGIGSMCIDAFSPNASIAVDTLLDGSGNASVTVGIPNIPGLTNSPPTYALALVVDFTLPSPFISLSKTVAVHFENGDGYSATGLMNEARALHTATALNETDRDQNVKVFVAGGGAGDILGPTASMTTEVYSPLTRSFTAGPNMAFERVLHQSVRLADGRVLITGGFDTSGAAHDSCEIYDPVAGTITPTGSMAAARGGHIATRLPNGNVLVTGGLADFSGGLASTSLAMLLNGGLDSGEVYDPNTGMWSATANTMNTKRFVHAQALLPNGTVLVCGGINGGTTIPFAGVDVPTFTSSAQIYDPLTNSFTTTGSMPQAVAGHGLSILGNGSALMTGGIISISPFLPPSISTSCNTFSGGSWSSATPLATGVALHTQSTAEDNGDALVHGGLGGSLLAPLNSAAVGRHAGSSFSPLGDVGLNPGTPAQMSFPVSTHTMTRLYDGTFLLLGGADDVAARDTGYVYLED